MADLFAALAQAKPKEPKKEEPPAVDAAVPCSAYHPNPTHVCSVGGGDASFSSDNGKTWQCRAHVPKGFFPKDRAAC